MNGRHVFQMGVPGQRALLVLGLALLGSARASASPPEVLSELALHPTDPRRVALAYAGGGQGLLFSDDGGHHFRLRCGAAVGRSFTKSRSLTQHQLGVHAKLDLTRAGQTWSLHDAPFDFEDQQIYELDELMIRDGDVLTTTCSYENDTGRTVRFGQSSDDEMCFNFVTYYPMGAFQCGFSL